MGLKPSHIRGTTFHGRKGTVANAFRYGVDYVLVEPEADQQTPWLFSRNRRNLCTLHDKDHGGDRSAGEGAAWVRRILASRGLDALKNAGVELLAQIHTMNDGPQSNTEMLQADVLCPCPLEQLVAHRLIAHPFVLERHP